MDLEQLLDNIKNARDKAREDGEAIGAELDRRLAAKDVAGTGHLSGLVAACETVEIALSRILGETKTRGEN